MKIIPIQFRTSNQKILAYKEYKFCNNDVKIKKIKV